MFPWSSEHGVTLSSSTVAGFGFLRDSEPGFEESLPAWFGLLYQLGPAIVPEYRGGTVIVGARLLRELKKPYRTYDYLGVFVLVFSASTRHMRFL